jgi:DNA modification methylase
MATSDSTITDKYAIYNGDCIEVMKTLPDESVGLTVYSPPFCGLYLYSSDARDMSNAIDKDEFFVHYGFCIDEIARLTKPGRISAVHCMDIPLSNAGCDAIYDLPGEIIRQHVARGFEYGGRRVIWKEPLMVRNRTMMKSLHHKTFCEDSTRCSIANADYLLMFRKKGENQEPVLHENGMLDYHGEQEVPHEIRHLKGMVGDQKKNSYSQWIWRNYASSVWMDIRIDNVLDVAESRDEEDEKHVHPLQLDVICRAVEMWSNPGDVVLTPFMGVGSEVYGAVKLGRRGIGIELKPSYYRQAVKNIARLSVESASAASRQLDLFSGLSPVGVG